MGQTSWVTNSEGEEVYVDKGAISMPTPSIVGGMKYAAAKAEAMAKDKIEWPTNVAGQTDQGM